MSRLSRLLGRTTRLVLVTTAGGVLVVVGIALSLPGVPGPGLLLVIAGLAILSKEFDWARRLTTKLSERLQDVRGRARQRAREGDGEHPETTGPRVDVGEDEPRSREPAA